MNHLITCMLIFLMYSELNEARENNTVVIFNGLPPRSILKFHCRSKDQDLGVLELKFNARPYFIEFVERSKQNRIVWNCIFEHWPNKEKTIDIQVYRSARSPRGGEIRTWIAREDGIYFTKNSIPPPVWVLPWIKI